MLRRLLAMSGFAGLRLAKKRKREAFALKKESQNLLAACADPAAGKGARIVEI